MCVLNRLNSVQRKFKNQRICFRVAQREQLITQKITAFTIC